MIKDIKKLIDNKTPQEIEEICNCTNSNTSNKGIINTVYDKLNKIIYSKKEIEALKDIKMQIDNFIPRNHITMIYAPSNTGKTTATLGLMNYILKNDKSMTCYYCDYDNGVNTMKPHLLKILNNTDKFNYISHDKASKELLMPILIELTKENLENFIFVFDSLQHFIDSDISSTKSEPALKKLFELMKRLRGAGATIIILSHTTKEKDMNGKETTFRGLNIIKDNLDNMFYLIRQGNDSYIFNNQKSRANISSIIKSTYNHDKVMLSDFKAINNDEYKQLQNKKQDEIIINIIRDLLKRDGSKCQKDILELLKEDDNIHIGKDKIKIILSRYINKFWTMKKTGARNHINSYTLIEATS